MSYFCIRKINTQTVYPATIIFTLQKLLTVRSQLNLTDLLNRYSKFSLKKLKFNEVYHVVMKLL